MASVQTAKSSFKFLQRPPRGSPGTFVVKMTVPWTCPVPSAVSEVVEELQFVDTRLEEMSRQVSKMQTYAKRWTLSAPHDRYEKRVGNAEAFFGPKDWDDIIAFAQASQWDWVIDPWNFYFMLEHLADRFAAKVEFCRELNYQFYLAARELEKILAKYIPEDRANRYHGMLEEQTMHFLEMVDGAQDEVNGQLRKTIEVSRHLERIGMWK